MRKLLVIVLLLILIDQCGRHARRSALNEPVAPPAVSAHINHSNALHVVTNNEQP